MGHYHSPPGQPAGLSREQGGDQHVLLTLAPDSGWRRFRDGRGVATTVPALRFASAGMTSAPLRNSVFSPPINTPLPTPEGAFSTLAPAPDPPLWRVLPHQPPAPAYNAARGGQRAVPPDRSLTSPPSNPARPPQADADCQHIDAAPACASDVLNYFPRGRRLSAPSARRGRSERSARCARCALCFSARPPPVLRPPP